MSVSLPVHGLYGSCRPESETRTQAVAADHGVFLNLDPKVNYVGDEDCALCHSEIFKSLKQTGMWRSFYPPSTSNLVEDFSHDNHVYDAANKARVEFERTLALVRDRLQNDPQNARIKIELPQKSFVRVWQSW